MLVAQKKYTSKKVEAFAMDMNSGALAVGVVAEGMKRVGSSEFLGVLDWVNSEK